MYTKKLKFISTRAPKQCNKEKIKKETAKLKLKLEKLQNLMYAEKQHSLLVVLQGMDASGKDGITKNVFNITNPLGTRVVSFKKPTEIEMKHDFLWRIHPHTPEKGMISIFNRSHYEDVIVQRVHNWVTEKIINHRFDNINNFEKLLSDSGTTVMKFYMHVSKDVQLERLKERMSDKTKMWKHNDDDIKERVYWDQYMKAYQDVFEKCNKASKWNIVPSDQNWYKEYVVVKKIVEAMESMNMCYPGLKNE